MSTRNALNNVESPGLVVLSPMSDLKKPHVACCRARPLERSRSDPPMRIPEAAGARKSRSHGRHPRVDRHFRTAAMQFLSLPICDASCKPVVRLERTTGSLLGVLALDAACRHTVRPRGACAGMAWLADQDRHGRLSY